MGAISPGPNWAELSRTYRRQLPLERRALRSLLDLLAVRPDERLLDVATGPAPLLAALAGRPERPTEAIGIDSSAAMLALAPDLPPGWELRDGDATALPFDDASFDVITASYLLHFLPEKARNVVIAEIARVLRPGGRVGTITVAPPSSVPGRLLAAPLIAAARRSTGSLASLRPLDPRPELEVAGFGAAAVGRTLLGYPSLCLVARR